jgi:hypothetical protein
VVASCRVRNAFEAIGRGKIIDDYRYLLENKTKFEESFGTHFVRGVQTGGEFYLVLQVTSTSQDTQSSLGTAFHAECQGLVASGAFDAAYKQAKQSTNSKTQFSLISYQKAGQDGDLSLVSNATEVIGRLKDFPSIARRNPYSYEAEVADYVTLPLPEINAEELINREISLTDCARLRLKYITIRNDIDFARDNRAFFDGLPPTEELDDWKDKYTHVLTLVQKHAQSIAARKIEPTVFDLAKVAPDLSLPLVNFKRVDVPSNIGVPPLVGRAVADAKSQLAGFGLAYEGDGRPVDSKGRNPLQTVTAQQPPAGSMVPPERASGSLTSTSEASVLLGG